MTFHVGQLIVCVNDAPNLWSEEPVKVGGIYRVLWEGMSGQGPRAIQVSDADIRQNGCWNADWFRPLNDSADDLELIASIKNCGKVPVTEPGLRLMTLGRAGGSDRLLQTQTVAPALPTAPLPTAQWCETGGTSLLASGLAADTGSHVHASANVGDNSGHEVADLHECSVPLHVEPNR